MEVIFVHLNNYLNVCHVKLKFLLSNEWHWKISFLKKVITSKKSRVILTFVIIIHAATHIHSKHAIEILFNIIISIVIVTLSYSRSYFCTQKNHSNTHACKYIWQNSFSIFTRKRDAIFFAFQSLWQNSSCL